MVRTFFVIVGLLVGLVTQTHANDLVRHFLPTACRTHAQPVLIVADVTRSGEIDDSVTLRMYRELERRGCVDVIGLVSIFGNGGSSTEAVHRNLAVRLGELGLDDWNSLVLRGPDHTMFRDLDVEDHDRHTAIARVVKQYRNVVIVELGPMTTSARLLAHGFVTPNHIERVVGVGGRAEGERFATNKGSLLLRGFGFRDMNIAEDTRAVQYLMRHYSEKLWMVTYQTGVGDRMLRPETVAAYAPSLAKQAYDRAALMKKLGYRGIPSWDTWTTSYFLKGGAERLGCTSTRAALRYADKTYRDPMQLWLHLPDGEGRRITACHTMN